MIFERSQTSKYGPEPDRSEPGHFGMDFRSKSGANSYVLFVGSSATMKTDLLQGRHDLSWEPEPAVLALQRLRSLLQGHAQPWQYQEAFTRVSDALMRAQASIANAEIRIDFAPELRRSLNLARDYMLAHLSESIRFSKIATSVHLSVHQFYRLFRIAFGETPSQFLSRARLDRAATLLLKTEFPVTQVAEVVGFESLNSFNMAFKHKFGLLPEDFRSVLSEAERTASAPALCL